MDAATIAAIGSGVLSSAGQIYANQRNLEQTNKWNDVQIDLANTAHQREVLDLMAAGLNPILSASGSGSAVPQLTGADFSNPGEGLSRGISSAAKMNAPVALSQVAVNAATAKNLDAQNTNIKAQNALIAAQTFKTLAEGKYPGVLGSAMRSLFNGVVDTGAFIAKSGGKIPRVEPQFGPTLHNAEGLDRYKTMINPPKHGLQHSFWNIPR